MNALDTAFSALSDPTRRAILARLSKGPATVGDLSRPFEISAPAISRHLKVLESAGLIANQRQGKHRLCSLNADALNGAADWIEQHRAFWNGSFDRLDQRLQQQKQTKDRKP